METIILKAMQHRNMECIGIYFTYQSILTLAIKKLPGIKWSQTNKCWYLPLLKEQVMAITTAVGKKALVETSHLKMYLQKRNLITATVAIPVKKQVSQLTPLPTAPVYQLGKENLEALEKFIQLLTLKAYSPSTKIGRAHV